MPVTEAQLKATIVGSFTGELGVYVADNIEVWWDFFASSRNISRLQFWRTEQFVLNQALKWLGPRAISVKSKDEFMDLHQQVETLEGRLLFAEAQIAEVRKRARATGAGAVGRLTTRSPITPDDVITDFRPDAAGRLYRGDAYYALMTVYP